MEFPKQVEEAANLAEELHGRMFNANPQPEVQEEEEGTNEQVDTPEQKQEDTEDYVAKYKTLQGKYNAEVPRLHQELRELKEMVFAKIGDASKQVQQEAPKQDPYAEKLAKYKDEYGEDMLEMARLIAQQEAESRINAALKDRVEPVKQQIDSVEETQIRAAQENFMSYLDGVVKSADGKDVDWRGLWSGKDPKFVEFLSKPDPSGLYTYGDLARLYNDNWDADKLAVIFNTYTQSQAPAPKQQTKPNPVQEAIVAPSRTTQHVAPDAGEKRLWSQDMISEFQKNDRAGKYDSETSKAMWEDLLSALGENRIRG